MTLERFVIVLGFLVLATGTFAAEYGSVSILPLAIAKLPPEDRTEVTGVIDGIYIDDDHQYITLKTRGDGFAVVNVGPAEAKPGALGLRIGLSVTAIGKRFRSGIIEAESLMKAE